MSNLVALATHYLILIGWVVVSLPAAILVGYVLRVNGRPR